MIYDYIILCSDDAEVDTKKLLPEDDSSIQILKKTELDTYLEQNGNIVIKLRNEIGNITREKEILNALQIPTELVECLYT